MGVLNGTGHNTHDNDDDSDDDDAQQLTDVILDSKSTHPGDIINRTMRVAWC